MNRFCYLNGIYVNANTIANVCDLGKGKCRVTYKNGLHEDIPNSYMDSILGECHIVQIIPCSEPVTAIYKGENEEGESTIYEEDIFYLGLCADGQIKPVVLQEGEYGVLDVCNFKGLVSKRSDAWRESIKSNWDEICDMLGFKMETKK